MAFKRENFKSLVSTKKEYFASSYGLKAKTNFGFNSDVYVIPLVESGFYEIPCHRVITHKVDKKEIGFNGAAFPVYIKCKGVADDGSKQDALCCTFSQIEKDRFPEKNDSVKRIISSQTWRVFFPILILGNSLTDEKKTSYPVSKVALSKDLASESGLKFSYLEMSSSTFRKDLVTAYGNNLKDKGILDYDLDTNTEEFFEEIRKRLSRTIVKIHGGTKAGFTAPLKEYSFFPFEDPAIACQSAPNERELITTYDKNDAIMIKVSEFLALFDSQVDSLIRDWDDKDLQEYYNSARGLDIHASLQEVLESSTPSGNEETQQVAETEKVEFETVQQTQTTPSATKEPATITQDQAYNPAPAASDEDIADLLGTSTEQPASDTELDEYAFDMDEDGEFFGDEE